MAKNKLEGINVRNPYTMSDFELEFNKDVDKTHKNLYKALAMCDRAYKVRRIKI